MTDFDPEAIYKRLLEAGDDWTDKEAAANLLEETKKTVLAELMVAKAHGSAAERERSALADPAFRLHVTGMVAARKEANRAKVRYDSAKVLAELRRTQESTRRVEAYQR